MKFGEKQQSYNGLIDGKCIGTNDCLQRHFLMLSLDAFDFVIFPLMKLTKQIRKLPDARTTSEFSEVSTNFHFGIQPPAKNHSTTNKLSEYEYEYLKDL